MTTAEVKLPENTVIALMGPTASGKTALAIELSKQLPAEVISVDSALVYRGMDIGTAKPDAEELAAVPHHLIDIRDPADPYSAKDFCDDASNLIDEILQRGKTPILAGGTMLYFKALLQGIADMPAGDEEIRKEIEILAAEKGWPHVHELLAEVDPETADRLHPNHSQRLQRALEVYRVSGKPMSYWHAQQTEGLLNQYKWLQLAIAPRDRSVLHQRIEQRFALMLQQGFEQEVRSLMARADLNKELPAIRSVGYRQMWEHLEGLTSAEEMFNQGVAATRQLAKRQITWLRSWHDLSWVYTQSECGEMLTSDEILKSALKIVSGMTI